MRYQKEIKAGMKPIDLALRLALGGAFLTAGLTAYQRLRPLASRTNSKPAIEARADDSPAIFYSIIGRVSDDSQNGNTPQAVEAKYTLELRQTKTEQEAAESIAALKVKGIEAFFTPLHQAGHVKYRIRTGVFETPAAADLERNRLAQTGLIPTVGRL